MRLRSIETANRRYRPHPGPKAQGRQGEFGALVMGGLWQAGRQCAFVRMRIHACGACSSRASWGHSSCRNNVVVPCFTCSTHHATAAGSLSDRRSVVNTSDSCKVSLAEEADSVWTCCGGGVGLAAACEPAPPAAPGCARGVAAARSSHSASFRWPCLQAMRAGVLPSCKSANTRGAGRRMNGEGL